MSLYAGFYQPLMLQIITHWSIATGRDIKDPATALTSGAVLRATAPGAIAVPSPLIGTSALRAALPVQ